MAKDKIIKIYQINCIKCNKIMEYIEVPTMFANSPKGRSIGYIQCPSCGIQIAIVYDEVAGFD